MGTGRGSDSSMHKAVLLPVSVLGGQKDLRIVIESVQVMLQERD